MSEEQQKEERKKIKPLDDNDISLIKRYGMGPYATAIKSIEEENTKLQTEVN
jgi:26S proteasome regulatory subunit T1